jgi:adenosylcobyric acid synthase
MIRLADGVDGAVSADGKVMGCYLHGLFASDLFRHAFLDRIRARPSSGVAYDAEVERVLDDLADHLETHLDVDGLLAAAAPIDG